MLLRLLFIFTVIPIVELAILIPLGGWIGVWPTVALVVATGILGAVLGKQQGIAAWRRIRHDLRQGKLPGDSLLDGLAILIAGAFLITPGVLTDIAGMVLLIPALRSPVKKYLKKRFKRSLETGSVTFIQVGGSAEGSPFGDSPFGQRPNTAEGDVIDVTPGPSDTGAEESEDSGEQPQLS
ncbi:MAG: FxsA family protein [Persicimonas sp.]